LIDLGPDGGDKGGGVVAVGTPEQVARCEVSYTGQYLRPILEKEHLWNVAPPEAPAQEIKEKKVKEKKAAAAKAAAIPESGSTDAAPKAKSSRTKASKTKPPTAEPPIADAPTANAPTAEATDKPKRKARKTTS